MNSIQAREAFHKAQSLTAGTVVEKRKGVFIMMDRLLKRFDMNRFLSSSALFVLVFASCATQPTVNYGYPESGSVNNSAAVPVKDYETAGIVFVKSSEVIDSAGNHTGSKITYEMLMLEAQKLDADDILNIRIDVNEVHEVLDGSSFFSAPVTRTTYNYTATALAIRYTTVVPVRDAAGYLPVMETGVLESRRSASASKVSASDSDAWKKKWVYLGGVLGGGTLDYEQKRYYSSGGSGSSYSEYDDSYGLFAAGAVADFALLDFFSIGTILGVGVSTGDGGVYPVLPLLGKLGYRFGGMEAWLDVGYTLGLGFTLGGTVGFHVGPGVLFAEALYVHGHLDIDDDAKHLFVGMLGYKIGIGNKQKRT
ncbi:MAG: hypothetical protein LBH75_04290 [Treponema sp.]|jgi:hypothetical protein|nr:hypothetical protein [Treponema sp.]